MGVFDRRSIVRGLGEEPDAEKVRSDAPNSRLPGLFSDSLLANVRSSSNRVENGAPKMTG